MNFIIKIPECLFNNDEFVFKRDKSNISCKEIGIDYYDHFIDPYGHEIIILPFYTKSDLLDFLKINNFLIVSRTYGNEPCLFAYKKPTIKNIVEKKYSLSIMTLFYSEQNKDLDIFYQYYVDQGVDHFFMYYNGEMSEKKNLPTDSKITYVEWNFKYWLKQDGLKHHAQIPAMIHFHKKYLPYCKYAMMIDTDEFIYCKEGNIKNYLIQNNIQQHLYTRHNWAKINFSEGDVNFVNNNPKRGKTIIYSDGFEINNMPSVHKLKKSQDCEIDLFHNNKKQHNIRNYNEQVKIKQYGK